MIDKPHYPAWSSLSDASEDIRMLEQFLLTTLLIERLAVMGSPLPVQLDKQPDDATALLNRIASEKLTGTVLTNNEKRASTGWALILDGDGISCRYMFARHRVEEASAICWAAVKRDIEHEQTQMRFKLIPRAVVIAASALFNGVCSNQTYGFVPQTVVQEEVHQLSKSELSGILLISLREALYYAIVHRGSTVGIIQAVRGSPNVNRLDDYEFLKERQNFESGAYLERWVIEDAAPL